MWYTHKKQSGGSGQYAKLCMVYTPNPGEGFEFANEVIGGSVPKEYVPGVVKGTEGSLMNGIRMGFPVVDVKATLKDGGFHPVDSSSIAFEIAARACFKEGASQAKPIVMEPIMKVEVITPEEYMGNIIGDLNSRRGIVNELGTRSNLHVVNASVPLAERLLPMPRATRNAKPRATGRTKLASSQEMFSYIAELRNISKGRANYSMEFQKYEAVPDNEKHKKKPVSKKPVSDSEEEKPKKKPEKKPDEKPKKKPAKEDSDSEDEKPKKPKEDSDSEAEPEVPVPVPEPVAEAKSPRRGVLTSMAQPMSSDVFVLGLLPIEDDDDEEPEKIEEPQKIGSDSESEKGRLEQDQLDFDGSCSCRPWKSLG
eukprot:g32051.t1